MSLLFAVKIPEKCPSLVLMNTCHFLYRHFSASIGKQSITMHLKVTVIMINMALLLIVFHVVWGAFPSGNYIFKVNNRNTRTKCEICSKLTIKTPERRHLRRSGVFIVNFEHISHLVLVFLLLTLNK